MWYKNGVPQGGIKEDVEGGKSEEGAIDLEVERIMADAKIAQNKRDRVCKSARSRS
jgi:hypothetical protein